MWLRGVQFVQEEPASAPSTSPSEPRELPLRAARAWARPMAIGEGGASVVGDSAKTACCDNVPLARYFQHFTLFHAPPLTSDIMPGAVAVLTARLRVIARICDN